MTSRISIITTGDGSHSLVNEDLEETYHSTHGAMQESSHVFIKHGLQFWSENFRETPRILEIGFGTGLNALLVLSFAETQHMPVYYESLETHPLPKHIYSQLNYPVMMGSNELTVPFQRMHETEWDMEVKIGSYFTFQKKRTSVHTYNSAVQFQIIFFDAFAPSKQASMWTLAVMEEMYRHLAPGGILVTYCAQGQFKRNLKEAGFSIETLQGPPGKKEMVRAMKV